MFRGYGDKNVNPVNNPETGIAKDSQVPFQARYFPACKV